MRYYSGSVIAIFMSIVVILMFFIMINPKVETMRERAIEYNQDVLNILNN